MVPIVLVRVRALQQIIKEMKQFFKKAFAWLGESNRIKHLIAGTIIGLVAGLDAGIIAGLAVEYKDWAYQGQSRNLSPFEKGSGWDWLDIAATSLGAVLGSLIRMFFFKTIL